MAFSSCFSVNTGDHLRSATAVEIFSEIRRRAAIGAFEGRGEVAVTGEAEILRESREILPFRDQVERACQPQVQVIAIQRHALHLLEGLREIHGRTADLRRDPGQRPATRKVGGEQHLDPVHQAPPRMGRARCAGGARTERTRDQRERQALGLERLDAAVAQRMLEQHHQRLRARIDAQMLHLESGRLECRKQIARRELRDHGLRETHHQAGVTARQRMADLVSLVLVEEQYVIGVGHRLVLADVPQIQAAEREHEVRVRGTFIGAAVAAGPAAIYIAHVHHAGVQKAIHREFLRHWRPTYSDWFRRSRTSRIRSSVKVVPPVALLSTPTPPPCASATDWTSTRPRPHPALPLRSAVEVRRNGRNRVGRSSGEMGSPKLWTAICTRPWVSMARSVTMLSVAEYLRALSTRFCTARSILSRS